MASVTGRSNTKRRIVREAGHISWQELLQSQPPPAKQLVSDADAGMAVSDRALDAAKGLHQKPNRHRRELDVEFTKQPYQPIVRQHAVDRERHFRLKLNRGFHERARDVNASLRGKKYPCFVDG